MANTLEIAVRLRPGNHFIQNGDDIQFVITQNNQWGSTCLALEGGEYFTRVLGQVEHEDLAELLNTVPMAGAPGVASERRGPVVGSDRVPAITRAEVAFNSPSYNGYAGPGDQILVRVWF